VRDETRMQRDTTFAGEALGALDEDYRAAVKRMALFAQDEWAVMPRLQAYLGLRWEGLWTDVDGRTMTQVRNRSSVVSPVAQLLWKLPGSDKDQIRLALSRSYKAPATRLLVPRRYTVNNGNSPTNPDARGNPQLRPELAWGLDGGYEHYFGKGGVASISAYMRRVEGVIVNEVDPLIRPWLSSPSNKGNARVAGIESDTRFSPRPNLDLRANVGYNWSRLGAVPGPDNRLAEQVAITSNLGIDYSPAPALAVGMNLNVQFAGPQRISEAQRAYTGPRRNLDLCGLWKMTAKTSWRLSASDALQQERVTTQAYASDAAPYQRTIVETNRIMVKLQLEMRI
jgi:outer membrane receptor for ferrienterochelin and colicins